MVLELAYWAVLGLVAGAYLGYPALLVCVARTACRIGRLDGDWEPSGEVPPVTLVIPVHNEASVAHLKLANCRGLEYPADKLHVVVVNDSSTDGTREILESISVPNMTIVHTHSRSGKAGALTEAMRHVGTELICFSDANVFLRANALSELVRPFSDARVGATTADVRLQSQAKGWGIGERLYYQVERSVQLAESALWSTIGVDGGLFVVRRRLAEPIPQNVVLDDFVIAMNVLRSGHRIIYCPDAIAEEDAPPTVKQEFRRRVRMATGVVQSLRMGAFPRLTQPITLLMYLAHKLLRWMSPVLVLCLIALSASCVRYHWTYAVPLVGFGVITLLGGLSLVSRRVRESWPGGIAVYFCSTVGAFLVGLAKGLIGTHSAIWAPTARTQVVPAASATGEGNE